MQELVKTKSSKFLFDLKALGFRLDKEIKSNTDFPLCVDITQKFVFRLTSIACLAGFAMAKKKILSQEEFLNKYNLKIRNR